MRGIVAIARELLGLFVDDARFAVAVLVWLGLVWRVLPLLGLPAGAEGPILFAGLAALLVGSVLRRAHAGLTRKAARR